MQPAVFFGVVVLVFGMDILGSAPLVALIGVLVALFSVGLGLLVSNLVRSLDAVTRRSWGQFSRCAPWTGSDGPWR